ncbi:hydroxyisourate hydrolase [Paenibacillus montanisoli]|uniref:5-hydroxyisourate hydrolase n=1 Tax=Paenibacillus montanisoli TaxID=2081970 RepID=A0A328UD60_9BACL|nr:hydroxyisourate hydrolase [Paenibacillus montanisoli]RAP78274.1 hydroxyisourate hydrolase [Paenibacillus montanisoli]
MRGQLTTHVLDTTRGKPAAGMRIQLWVRSSLGRAPQLIKEVHTNADGRVDAPLLSRGELHYGEYELVFDVGGYFGDGNFLNLVPVRFVVDDPEANYHIPLLVAPGGYSTYRGS